MQFLLFLKDLNRNTWENIGSKRKQRLSTISGASSCQLTRYPFYFFFHALFSKNITFLSQLLFWFVYCSIIVTDLPAYLLNIFSCYEAAEVSSPNVFFIILEQPAMQLLFAWQIKLFCDKAHKVAKKTFSSVNLFFSFGDRRKIYSDFELVFLRFFCTFTAVLFLFYFFRLFMQ